MTRSLYDVLADGNIGFSALSWNGFNVYGDEDSIAEVRRLRHQDYVAEYLRKELITLREAMNAFRVPGSM